jgi:hypothetical protein
MEKRTGFPLLISPKCSATVVPFNNRSQERYRIISKQTIVEVLWIRKYFLRIRIRNWKIADLEPGRQLIGCCGSGT